jgi:hypothetical protein
MTRFIHDLFAKEYLAEMLSPIGIVNIGRDVTSEVREIDVYFTPTTVTSEYVETLGLLGKMATGTAIFEPFRNPVRVSEVCSCLSKLLDVRGELERQARRQNTRWEEAEIPKLWIFTPTASRVLLDGFNAKSDNENWIKGIYFLGKYLRAAIVVIHSLPETPQTLWLRILGRGKVQQRAIAQLSTLALDDPMRINALELLYRLQSNLVADSEQELDPEERGLIMAIAPLFQEQLQLAKQQGVEEGLQLFQEQLQLAKQQGIEQGREQQQRLILEDFLRERFGELTPEIAEFISPISTISVGEFTRLLMEISMLTVDELGREEVLRLLIEKSAKL